MTIRQDDRTADQQSSHRYLIVGTDPFMSNLIQGGDSYAAWACRYEDVDTVQRWVERRSDMRRVRLVIDRPGKRYYPSKSCAHLHIYVVDQEHPSLTDES